MLFATVLFLSVNTYAQSQAECSSSGGAGQTQIYVFTPGDFDVFQIDGAPTIISCGPYADKGTMDPHMSLVELQSQQCKQFRYNNSHAVIVYCY
jgi:hypothetical protein